MLTKILISKILISLKTCSQIEGKISRVSYNEYRGTGNLYHGPFALWNICTCGSITRKYASIIRENVLEIFQHLRIILQCSLITRHNLIHSDMKRGQVPLVTNIGPEIEQPIKFRIIPYNASLG